MPNTSYHTKTWMINFIPTEAIPAMYNMGFHTDHRKLQTNVHVLTPNDLNQTMMRPVLKQHHKPMLNLPIFH